MHPTEFFWMMDLHKKPPDYGRLTPEEVEMCYQELSDNGT
jgi:hypothetical protein